MHMEYIFLNLNKDMPLYKGLFKLTALTVSSFWTLAEKKLNTNEYKI